LLILFFIIAGCYANPLFAQLPPGKIQLKTIAAGNQLAWEDGGSNGSTTFIRYEIGRSTTSGAGYTVIGNTTGLSYTDTTAVAGTAYYYVVRDVHSSGTTAWSEEVIRFFPFDAATAEAQFYKNEKMVNARWPLYENEIVKTFVGLSTVPGEANLVSFIDVGHATEHCFRNLNLVPGQTYYVTVKVQNTSGYLNNYGTSICSSQGFMVDITRDLVDTASSTYFNNAQARVMTSVSAGAVGIQNFSNNVLRRYRMPVTLTETGIESRFNAPVAISLSGTDIPAVLSTAQQQIRVADEWGNEVPCMVTAVNGYTEQLIYESGAELEPFVAGYSAGTGAQTKTATYMQVSATANDGQRTYVTDSAVDLTAWDQVVITWQNAGGNSANQYSHLAVSTSKMSDYATNNAILTKQNTFAQTTATLDVSSLNGSYYIRVHARRVINQNSVVNTYRIALRKLVTTANLVIIANLPKGKSRTYWIYWGNGSATPAAFPNSTNATSQKAWSPFYSRKLLPPGVENFTVSDYTKLTAPGNTDDGTVAVTLPWGFNFFGTYRKQMYFAKAGSTLSEPMPAIRQTG
jgi:hypothetical protein